MNDQANEITPSTAVAGDATGTFSLGRSSRLPEAESAIQQPQDYQATLAHLEKEVEVTPPDPQSSTPPENPPQ
jgi:hypothetical protein